MNEEKERRALIAQKKKGQFNLLKHLQDHPISSIIGYLKLSDDHPLMRLKKNERNP